MVVRPQDLTRAVRALKRTAGVSVHHTHEPTGRIVATIEAETVEGEIEILEGIQRRPWVVLAEMVEHHVDVDEAGEGDRRE